jgi:hypothetical protein
MDDDTDIQETTQEEHQAAEELKGEVAQVNKQKDKAESDKADKTDVNINALNDSKAKISLYFQQAIGELDKVDADGKIQKKQIIRKLAKKLEEEGLLPIDRIAYEITHQLHKKASESLVYAALDEKYKTAYRVQNAKRKKKKERTESLAPALELKPEILVFLYAL